MEHFISASCGGEYCRICQAPATHKVGEEIMSDDPNQMRHNLTGYVCCKHFRLILGLAVSCPVISYPIESDINNQGKNFEKITFGELLVSQKFIEFPMPGDNSSYLGFRILYPIYIKSGPERAVTERGAPHSFRNSAYVIKVG